MFLAGAVRYRSTASKPIKFNSSLGHYRVGSRRFILNLALFFAYHPYCDQEKGFDGQFDYIAAVITLAACIALFKFNQKAY